MQISELEDRVDNLERKADKEYNSGLAFSYNCIMFILKKEYLELGMSKLEEGVNRYMEEQSEGAKGQEEPPEDTDVASSLVVVDASPSTKQINPHPHDL